MEFIRKNEPIIFVHSPDDPPVLHPCASGSLKCLNGGECRVTRSNPYCNCPFPYGGKVCKKCEYVCKNNSLKQQNLSKMSKEKVKCFASRVFCNNDRPI